MFYVGFASIAWTYGIRSVCECDSAIQTKIDDCFDFGIKPVYMPWLVVH